MKYYSDVTKALYETEEDLVKAETRVKQEKEARAKAEAEKRNARAADAKVVEDARKAMVAAQEKYNEAMNAFIKKYGAYHFTVDANSVDEFPHIVESFLNLFHSGGNPPC